MKNYCARILFVLFFLSLGAESAFASSSAGFVPGQIWYSKDKFVAGETIKIYTVVWNAGPNPLSARVEFYDKSIILGARDIVVEKEKLEQVSIPWSVTAGDHAISAKIISSTVSVSGKKESVVLDNRITTEDVVFVPASKAGQKSTDTTAVSSKDPLKNSLTDVSKKVTEAIPLSVREPFMGVFSVTEKFRIEMHKTILASKARVQKEIDAFSSKSSSGAGGTGEPIARLKIFSLSICAFFFATRVVFYGVGLFLLFTILKALYHKLRDR